MYPDILSMDHESNLILWETVARVAQGIPLDKPIRDQHGNIIHLERTDGDTPHDRRNNAPLDR